MAEQIRVVITGDASGLSRALGSAQSGLGRFAASAGAFAVRTGAAVGGAVLAVGGAALTIGVRAASQAEQAQVAFSTMLGSATAAKSFLGGLQDFANKTPFEFPDLVTASQRLLAMGFAAKDVIPTLTGIGDAVAGLGGGKEQIDQVTTAIGQMQAKGKIQSDELLQLTEAGIPALKILASSYGVTAGQMQEMVTKGKVLSSDAIPKLIAGIENGTASTQKFGGMMEAQSKTIDGLYSTLKDTVTTQLKVAVLALEPLIKEGLGKAIAFAAEQGPKLAVGMKAVIETVRGLYNILVKGNFTGPIFGLHEDSALVGFLLSLRDAAIAVYQAMQSGDLSKLGQAFSASTATAGPLLDILGSMVAVLPALSTIITVAADALRWLADHADIVIAALPVLIAAILLWKAATLAVVTAEIAAIPVRIAEVVATLAAARATQALAFQMGLLTGQQYRSTLAIIAGNVATAAQAAAAWVVRAAMVAWAVTMVLVRSAQDGTLWAATRATAAMVAQRVAMIASRAAMLVATAAQWAWNVAMTANPIGIVIVAIGALVAALIYAWTHSQRFRAIVLATWSAIKTAAAAVWDWIVPKVKTAANLLVAIFRNFSLPGIIMSHWGAIKSGATTAWNAVVGFISGVPGRIMGVFAGAGSWLLDIGRRIIDGLRRGIENGIGAVKAKLAEVTNLIPSWKGPPAKDAVLLRPAGRAIMGGLVTGIDTGLPALRSKLGDVTAAINVAPGAGWTPNRAGLATAGGALLHIENFYAGGQSTQAIAADLAWALRR